MLFLYGFCLVVGGIFVVLVALTGIEGADFDTDFDVDVAGYDKGDRPDAEQSRSKKSTFWWFPLCSLRFWTVGSCIFGLTGILLLLLQPDLPDWVGLNIALGMGIAAGTATVWALRWLRTQGSSDSLVRSQDLVGVAGIVELPFDHNSRGKVKLEVKGGQFYLQAMTNETSPLKRGDRVIVVGLENHRVWVVSEESWKSL